MSNSKAHSRWGTVAVAGVVGVLAAGLMVSCAGEGKYDVRVGAGTNWGGVRVASGNSNSPADLPTQATPAKTGAASTASTPDFLASVLALIDNAATPPTRRIIVYSARLNLVVAKIPEGQSAVLALVESFAGYLESQSGERLVVRVPAVKLNEFFAQLGSIGTIEHKEMQANDVTDRFVDLEARLVSAQAVQTRLRALVERAETVEAALKVEQELKRVDEQIEQLKGQLALLASQAAFSTVAITITTAPRPEPIKSVFNFGTLPFDWLREVRPDTLWSR